MSIGWFIGLVIGVMAAGLVLWLACRWMARSWEVLDDDTLSEKLANETGRWFWISGWFRRGPRRLFYRRDKRGRFRKIWRG